MSNWITIAKADLYNSKSATLIDAADTQALGAGQTGRTAGIIADVTLEIRRKVSRCNQLDQVTTAIPGGLKPLAVDIIFCRIKTALEMELSQDERALLNRREAELDRIADGKDLVDPPDNPIVAAFNQAVAQPVTVDRHRNFSRCEQEGL